MKPIHQEFDLFVEKYGYDILLVELLRHLKCACFTSVSGEAKGNCQDCYGSGYKTKTKTIRVRKKLNTMPQSNPTQFMIHDYGWDTTDGSVFYLRRYDVVKLGDFLIDLSWHNQPQFPKYKYIVSNVMPMRGDNGQIEFFQVYARMAHEGDFG